jgi:hypothetical protein
MHDPGEPHLTAMKRIMRYLQGTPEYGLLLRRSSSSDLVVYTNAGPVVQTLAALRQAMRCSWGQLGFLVDQAADRRLPLQR